MHTAGVTADGLQALQDGLNPGDEVIADALQFSTAMAEQKE